MPAPRSQVFLTITVGGLPAGQLVFELFDDIVPVTAQNFRSLCVGDRGVDPKSGAALCYRGTPIHRIVPGFFCHGGDIVNGDGTGGASIYGSTFTDESFRGEAGRHSGFGCLTMSNYGPHQNSSRFFICFAATPQLDGKHVVFGRLVEGQKTLQTIEMAGSRPHGEPLLPVIVEECGAVERRAIAAIPRAFAAATAAERDGVSPRAAAAAGRRVRGLTLQPLSLSA